jgi:hypothetical protein
MLGNLRNLYDSKIKELEEQYLFLSKEQEIETKQISQNKENSSPQFKQ